MRAGIYLLLVAGLAGVVATFVPLAHDPAALTFWDLPAGSAARNLGYLAFVPFVALLLIGGIALLLRTIDELWPACCVAFSVLGLVLLGLAIGVFHGGADAKTHLAIDWTAFAVAGAADLVAAVVATAIAHLPELEELGGELRQYSDRRRSKIQARRERRRGAVREADRGDGVAHARGHVLGEIGVTDVEHVDRSVGVD
jgi:hypothetical protein